MTTLELMQRLLTLYFIDRTPMAIPPLLTEDVHCYGLAVDTRVSSLHDASTLLSSEAYRQFTAYALCVEEQESLSPDNAALGFSLTGSGVTMHYRVTGSSRETAAGRKLCLLHFSLVNPRQTLTMYSDLAKEKQDNVIRGVIRATLPGGILGAYREPGFPLYSINDSMLRYLGYEDEPSFAADIGGTLTSAVYPDDRAMLRELLTSQLQQDGTYQADFRLRRCDHSYQWVHATGKLIRTEDGREAILSACYDITAEKEHAGLLHQLVSTMNASTATYLVEEDGHRLIPLYLSEHVGVNLGLNQASYLAQYQDDAMASIFLSDRIRVQRAITDMLRNDRPCSLTFRVYNAGRGYTWTNASCARHGTVDGKPVIRAIFTPASLQFELQLQALNQSNTGICVVGLPSREIFYANDTVFRILGMEPQEYAGRTCYELFRQQDAPCPWCSTLSLPEDGSTFDQVVSALGRSYAMHIERRMWNDTSVLVLYSQDVTEQTLLRQQAESNTRELQSLLSNMACGLCVLAVDPQNHAEIKYLSDGFCKMFDGTKEELLARHRDQPAIGVMAEDLPAVTAFLRKCLAEQGTDEITYRYTTKAGRHLWVALKLVVVPDGQGGRIGYATYFDVTARMHTQKQLSDLIHNVPGGVCMYRWDGTTLEPMIVSGQIANLLGVTEDAAVGNLSGFNFDIVHPSERQALREAVRAHLAEPGVTHTYTYRILHAVKQRYCWISTTGLSIPQEDGSQIVYATYADMDDIKGMEQQLLQEEEMLQAACDFAHVWSWVYELAKDRIHCFRRLRQDFDLPEYLENYPESWLSRGFIQPEYIQLHRDRVQAIRDGSPSEEFEVRLAHKDGSIHWSRIRINRLTDIPDIAICTSQLIDDEKYLEARMELEEKQQAEGGVNLMAHFITNLTRDLPVAHSYHFAEREELLAWPSLSEQLARTAKYIVFSDTRDRFLHLHDTQHLLDLFAQGQNRHSMDYRRKMPDGRILWVRSILHLLREPRTGDILNYEYLFNVTQQKISEELISSAISFGFELCANLMLDSDQLTVLRSPSHPDSSVPAVMSYTQANLAYAKTILPEDREMYLRDTSPEHILACFQVSEHFEIMHRTMENGVVRYKKDQCFHDAADSSACLLIRSDVTDVILQERKHQQALKEAMDAREALILDRELIYTALFSIMPVVISANLTQNRYTLLNTVHFTTKDVPRDGVYDQLVDTGASVVPEDERQHFIDTFGRDSMLRAFAEGKKTVLLEHQQCGSNGALRWVETRCVFIQNHAGGDLYTITLAQDVTPRKQQQVELQRALEASEAATQAKSEFLSRMSHEIRTPMNAIMGMTAIAKDSSSDFRQIMECLDKIDMSSHFLLTLINDILEMSRIESGRTEIKHTEFNFAFLLESIRTVVEPLALRSSIRYECQSDAVTDPYYLGDAMRIQQVLVNIITNAIKFTRPGGRVRFSIHLDSATDTAASFRFVVADTGIGMSEAFMKRMFQPFTQEDGSNTSEFGGSGLGLAISKSLTEAMGGAIAVDSFVGVGSTFTVSLTLTRMTGVTLPAPPNPDDRPAVPTDLLRGCHLLMAEDHPLNVMVARKLLERKGATVTVAENGQLAVDRFRESPAGTYDAILMDIRMPVMDGLDAARAIRALDRPDARTIPIVAMTANALDEDRQRSREVGMNAHLSKPFEPEQLYSVLAALIGTPSAQ